MTNGTTSPTTQGNSGNNNLIDSNDMRSGAANGPYYALVVTGPSAHGTANATCNNVVSNNNIQDFYLYGLYTYFANGTTIKGNTVHNTGITRFTTKYGMYIYYTSANVESNKVPQKLNFKLEYTQRGGWTQPDGELSLLNCYSIFSLDNLPKLKVKYS